MSSQAHHDAVSLDMDPAPNRANQKQPEQNKQFGWRRCRHEPSQIGNLKKEATNEYLFWRISGQRNRVGTNKKNWVGLLLVSFGVSFQTASKTAHY
jgi:uncharacterized membrane protein